jgi:hypothetical protein
MRKRRHVSVYEIVDIGEKAMLKSLDQKIDYQASEQDERVFFLLLYDFPIGPLQGFYHRDSTLTYALLDLAGYIARPGNTLLGRSRCPNVVTSIGVRLGGARGGSVHSVGTVTIAFPLPGTVTVVDFVTTKF